MPSQLREVETKYDVDDTTPLPQTADLPGVARVEGPVSHRLEATYFDTPDLALGRNGITLRRRTGGDDEGWHLKLPLEDGRQEIHARLGRSARTPPIALRRIVQGVVREHPMAPVAVLETDRTTVSLLGEDGALLAVFCDDRVSATRLTQDGDERHIWREWELEQHAAPKRLVKAADTRVRKAGAKTAEHGSKFGRVMAIGPAAEPAPVRTPGKRASEHELLGHHLDRLVASVRRLDPLARADVPDAVHQLRVACRRLRAILQTFDASFDSGAADPIREDLRWLRAVLGRPRDLEVLRERLDELVVAQPANLVRGRPGQWIDSQLRAAYHTTHREALDAMASERYFALIDALDSWRVAPPWTDQRDRPADKRLGKALAREWRRTERAVAAAAAADATDRPAALHEVRKAAKRARYAAETLAPVLGSDARALGRAAKEVHRVLGTFQDAVVTIDELLDLAAAAQSAGRDTLTFGVLAGQLEADLSEHERAFERVWKKVRKARP